jgi:hypothetical protein
MKIGEKNGCVLNQYGGQRDSQLLSEHTLHRYVWGSADQNNSLFNSTLELAGKITGYVNVENGWCSITSKERGVSNPVKISKRKAYSFILLYVVTRHEHVWRIENLVPCIHKIGCI